MRRRLPAVFVVDKDEGIATFFFEPHGPPGFIPQF